MMKKKEMWKNGNEGKVVMREYDYDNTRDDEKARGVISRRACGEL